MAENNAKAPEQESNFKALVLPVIVLVVICLVCSALLAVLNNATAPIIEANTKAETLAAYLSVLPEGTTADDLQDVTVTTAKTAWLLCSPPQQATAATWLPCTLHLIPPAP
mgnify:CR=1 FL=1